MGGMWPTEQTMKAYNDAKTKCRKPSTTPTRCSSRRRALSSSLAKYNVTLTAPTPTKPVTAAPVKKNKK